ncbi:hypothetical protein BV210_01610 [Halorientalis sp. IM1011]|uniref:nuclear transport factor 2 family protein n=1 Tax=Halorientalis sp. IM1011 TaxID=1932360 RepID=UPI00097CCEF6|nr:nuclear transport factor 2 family protein [Halorientalis sp. IM1011]AQL41489.1 hypothetical protein BV210_01610 [Halorientalis sp. IM1011]
MDAADTIRSYYDALRDGEPLGPFFASERPADDAIVKFGLSERLVGTDAVREGLREQTATTADWAVDSRALRATERERHAWFSDAVEMGWTDTEREIRYEFDTRWSGTLELRDGDWRFVGMHVSTAGDR